jgi:tetratricopeptide (TPR) repeat protein
LTLVDDRDDLYLERVTLYNLLANYDRSKALIAAREFHPWEGGEGKVVGQYLICHLELARKHICEGSYEQALSLLEAAETYPHHLGEGKLYGAQENDIFYLKGCAYEGLGKKEMAILFFEKASEGSREPLQAIYYNDQQPDKILYQGLALKKLDNNAKAEYIFNRLIDFGKQHLDDHIKIDYFAVSLPDLLVFDQDLDLRNKIHCYYMIGLGLLGLGDTEKAKANFDKVLAMDGNHQGTVIHLAMIHSGFLIRVDQNASMKTQPSDRLERSDA